MAPPALPPSAPLPPAQQPADALAAGADRTCEPAEPAAAALADDPVRPEPVLAVDDGRQAEGARRERRQGRAGRDAEEDDHCRAPGRKGGVSGCGRGIGGRARWASDGGGRTLELGRLVDGRASEDGTCDQGSRTVTRESISGRVRVGGAVLKATWSAPVMRPGMLTRPTIDIWLIVGSCSSGQVRGEDGRGRRQTSSAPREASPRFVTYERHLDRLARDRPRCLEARRALCPGSHDGSSAVVSRERPTAGHDGTGQRTMARYVSILSLFSVISLCAGQAQAGTRSSARASPPLTAHDRPIRPAAAREGRTRMKAVLTPTAEMALPSSMPSAGTYCSGRQSGWRCMTAAPATETGIVPTTNESRT